MNPFPVPDKTATASTANIFAQRIGRYRWKICALLFFATTINYVDRQVLGILAPYLQKIIGWNEAQYGYIVTAFQAAYALGLLVSGGIIDRVGTRLGYSVSVVIWSLSSMAHSLVYTPFGFGVVRFFLGLGESGNFPSAIKTVSEWFPKKERATAIGIFNSGSNIGAVIAPIAVPWIALHLGWRWAFLLTGIADFVWLGFWLATDRRPEKQPRLSKEELAYIRSDTPVAAAKIPWARLFRHRQTWTFAIGKFMTDPIWWFYLFWLPKYLSQSRGLSLADLAAPLVVIYLSADVGSLAGGWLSSFLLAKGWNHNRARKTVLFLCACCMLPILFISSIQNLWVVVGLIGLATGAHQGWSANLYAIVSDMFPERAVASVVGIGGMAGAVGGMLIASAAGLILQFTHHYYSLFLIAGSAYLAAFALIQLISPKLQPLHSGDI